MQSQNSQLVLSIYSSENGNIGGVDVSLSKKFYNKREGPRSTECWVRMLMEVWSPPSRRTAEGETLGCGRFHRKVRTYSPVEYTVALQDWETPLMAPGWPSHRTWPCWSLCDTYVCHIDIRHINMETGGVHPFFQKLKTIKQNTTRKTVFLSSNKR